MAEDDVPTWVRFLGLGLVAVFVIAAGGGYAYYRSAQTDGQAPDFTLTSTGYENGTQGENVTFSLSELEGEVVLLDFMAVMCTSCRVLEREVLRPIHDEYGARDDFRIISIDVWADPENEESAAFAFAETRESLIEHQKEAGNDWRHALDTDRVWQKYQAVQLPKIAIIDGQQNVVFVESGQVDRAKVARTIEAALDAEAAPVPLLDIGVFGFALLAGALSFFAPCSVGLIPAYMGFLLQGQKDAPVAVQARRTILGGALTAAGVIAVYALIAALLIPFGGAINRHLDKVGPLMGALLVVIGIVMLFGWSWDRIAEKLGMGKVDGRRGFFAFGVGYGLAAFGCVGPAFLPVLVLAFGQGLVQGLVVMMIYAGVLAAFMVYAAALVAAGRTGRLRRLLENTPVINRVAAVLMVVGGLFVIWFYGRAGALPF